MKLKTKVTSVICALFMALTFLVGGVTSVSAAEASNTDDMHSENATLMESLYADLKISDGQGGYGDGPYYVKPGDDVTFSASFDWKTLAQTAVVNPYSKEDMEIAKFSGAVRMKFTASKGLKFKSEIFDNASTDITDYFTGDAVDIFELAGKPVYDAADNSVTVTLKTKASIADEGISIAEVHNKAKSPMNLTPVFTATVTDEIAQTESNSACFALSISNGFLFNAGGYLREYYIDQCQSEYGEDPTIDSDGLSANERARIISATVLYSAPDMYNVTYAATSVTAGKDLPQEIMNYMPPTTQAEDGSKATPAEPLQKTVKVKGGSWSFAGYDHNSLTVNGADVQFVGKWKFTADGGQASNGSDQNGNDQGNKTPKTGDDINLMVWAAVLALAGAGGAGSLIIRRKNS